MLLPFRTASSPGGDGDTHRPPGALDLRPSSGCGRTEADEGRAGRYSEIFGWPVPAAGSALRPVLMRLPASRVAPKKATIPAHPA